MDTTDALKALMAKKADAEVKSKSVSVKESPIDECRRRLTEITHEYKTLSSIPLGHEYWEIKKKYQSLRNK